MLLFLFACTLTTDSSSKSDPTFPECRTDVDCTDGSSCWSADSCNVGELEVPPDECDATNPCADDGLCVDVPATSGVAEYHACVASCVTSGCDADSTCDTTSGLCVETSCADGYTCAAHFHCDTSVADDHGCVRDTCVLDAECGAGVCVEGGCYDDYGTCGWAVP